MELLTFCDYYLPGFRAGGTLRTLANMVERLGEEFRFRIVTSDRDLREAAPYAGVRPEEWQRVGNAWVRYLSPRERTMRTVRSIVRDTPHDALYLNSLFSPTMTLKPLVLRRLGWVPRRPVLLAPRGELSRDALALKAAKKRTWLATARALRTYEGVTWQASSEHEKTDILRAFPRAEAVVVAPDLCAADGAVHASSREKRAGALDIVFLGRIAPVKNLHGALALLEGVRGDIRFDIYGPVDDAAYQQECERAAARLAPNVRVMWNGALHPSEVPGVLARHHLLLLPSLGENFGHAIVEALQAGCLALISDRTPWRGLAAEGVGWDLPLEGPDRFGEALRACVAMDADAFRRSSLLARAYGGRCAGDTAVLDRNRALLTSLAPR